MELYNTLTRKKEAFTPIGDAVKMYSCGPTVYWYQHIGNMRTYLLYDILQRVLKYNGFDVTSVINVTDVGHLTADSDDGDDKMEEAAKKEGVDAQVIAEKYWSQTKQDFDKLHIVQPSIWCKATDHIQEQIDLIEQLEHNGLTYRTSDGIYYDSSKFPTYAELGRLNIDGLEEGKRVDSGEKRNKTDFALWKFSEAPGVRQQEWESPWGLGFPGWHIECSAMSMKYLGTHFDIHIGGEDHIQVHHTNEIAQSEGATGTKFVNYWVHGAFLMSKGEKVSKSKGGLYTLSELEELGYSPMDYRYLCLLTHYRKPLDFTLEHLDAAQKAFGRMKRKIIELKGQKHTGSDLVGEYESEFEQAINDDLNMPLAVQVVHKLLDDFDIDSGKKLALLEKFDSVLGLGLSDVEEEHVMIPDDVQRMIEEREHYRAIKEFEKADIVRDRIREKGFELEDSSDGVQVRKV